ncbi:hypothetical protein [Saccharothrix sp. HUAS TT1]|uniref:hypothetical protein n=1 Tax=unclassified Saccharothrix TaxID=2593673 RepID=UPI00345BDE82
MRPTPRATTTGPTKPCDWHNRRSKTRSRPCRARTWRVPAGTAVRIDCADGREWLAPTDHSTALAEPVTARARQ